MSPEEIAKVVNTPPVRKKKADRVVSSDRVSEIIRVYEGGASARSLVKTFNMEFYTIQKILGLSGVKVRTKGEQSALTNKTTGFYARAGLKHRKLSPDRFDQMLEMYDSGAPWDVLEKEFGLCQSSMLRHVKNAGIWREPEFRSYSLNEHYFDEIDTAEKAYFFGLLMSDGNVGKGWNNDIPSVVSISLKADDVDLLEQFRAAIGFSKELRDCFLTPPKSGRNTKPQKYLGIHSKVMAGALNRHGCTPRKSKTAKYPEWLREDLHRHFIRGYFDGNGCVTYGKRGNRTNLSFNFVGSEFMVDGIQKILHNQCGFSSKIPRVCPGCFTINYGGNLNVRKMHPYLYGDGGPFMKRKKDKWDSGMSILLEEEKGFGNMGRKLPVDTVVEMYRSGLSSPQIARCFDADNSTVVRILQKAGIRPRSSCKLDVCQ